MKNTCLLALLFFTFIAKSNSVKLDVYLNFNECINCFISLSYINQVDSTVATTLIIEKKDSAVSKEFLQQYNLDARIKTVYTQKTNLQSVCRLYSDNLLIEEFHLKELPTKLRKINTTERKTGPATKMYKLPGKITIKNDRADIIISDNYINLYDYILNKNITLKLSDSIQLVKEISGKNFTPEMFLQIKSNIDSVLYRTCKKTLVFLGKHIPHIEKAYFTDSSLFLLINFPTPTLEAQDTAINMKFFEYEYNYITNEKKLSFINDDAFSSTYHNDVFINNAQPFYYYNNSFHFSLYYVNKKQDSIAVLSRWKRAAKKQIYFNKQFNFKLPKTSWNQFEIDSNQAIVNSRFYFFFLHGVIYDYKAEKLYVLKHDFFSHRNFVADVCQTGDEFKLIVFTDEKPYLMVYNYKTQTIKSKTALELPEDYVANTLKFYNPTTLFSVNKVTTYVYLTSIR